MKILALMASFLLIVTFSVSYAAPNQGSEVKDVHKLTSNIRWLGHDSFRIEGKGWRFTSPPTALMQNV